VLGYFSVNAATIDDFLISLDVNNVNAGVRFVSYGGTLGGGHLDVNRSPAALVAANNMITDGWVRTGTY